MRRPRRPGAGRRLLPRVLAVAVALAATGCVAPPSRPETPEERARPGVPLGRSAHLRSGTLSWRLGQVEAGEDGAVRVDLVLQNGTSRSFDSLRLRVRVRGGPAEGASVQLPVGGLRAGRTHRVSARLPAVPFRVRDVAVELLSSSP